MLNELHIQMKFPQVIKDMANEQYHRGEWQSEFISSTTLKNMLVSPKYFRYSLTNPHEISLAARLQGSIYHSMLESLTRNGCIEGIYDEFFVFEAPVNPKTGEPYGTNTKAYKEEYEFQMLVNNGKTPISQEEINTAKAMVNALLNDCGNTSQMVETFLQNGEPEMSFFIEYEGARFKFRPDIITANKIVDWKSIASDDLKEETIARQISKMGYGFSAAFYQFFAHQATGKWFDFYWVFQQKSAPYDAVVVSANDWAYSPDWDRTMAEKGPSAIEFENVLNQYIKCNNEGYFPGAEAMVAPTGDYRIMYTLPNYKRNSVINFY